jgi:hypothetical protein
MGFKASSQRKGKKYLFRFLNDKLFFQTSKIGVSLTDTEMGNHLNSRDFLFIVTPKLKSHFHNEFVKANEELRTVEKNFLSQEFEGQMRTRSQFQKFQSRVSKAQERAEEESQANEALIKDWHGRKVTYGSEVQLIHRDSGMFLAASKECSNTDQIGFKVELSKFYKSSMIFKIHPRFNSREKGNPIQYGDQIFLENIKRKNHLCISDTQFTEAQNLGDQEPNPFK